LAYTNNITRELHLSSTDQKIKGNEPDIPLSRLVTTSGGAQESQLNNLGIIKEFDCPPEYQTRDEGEKELERLKEQIRKGVDELKIQNWKDEEWDEGKWEGKWEDEDWKGENLKGKTDGKESWKDENWEAKNWQEGKEEKERWKEENHEGKNWEEDSRWKDCEWKNNKKWEVDEKRKEREGWNKDERRKEHQGWGKDEKSKEDTTNKRKEWKTGFEQVEAAGISWANERAEDKEGGFWTKGGETESIVVNVSTGQNIPWWKRAGESPPPVGRAWPDEKGEYSHADDKLEGLGGPEIEVKTHQHFGEWRSTFDS
jgi:hypothetical protein